MNAHINYYGDANAADIAKRTPGTDKLISSSYTISETKDGTILLLYYGNGKLLSLTELDLDETFDYLNRIEAMALDMVRRGK